MYASVTFASWRARNSNGSCCQHCCTGSLHLPLEAWYAQIAGRPATVHPKAAAAATAFASASPLSTIESRLFASAVLFAPNNFILQQML